MAATHIHLSLVLALVIAEKPVGLGFNSSYHLTDVPSFVSGAFVCYFDPHATHLPLSNVNNPGKRINFLSPAPAAAAAASASAGADAAAAAPTSLLDSYPDQFAPFLAFGCDMRTHFRGTLFRFPLRTAAQAASSRLSGHAYAPEELEQLLASMYEDAAEMILFLKHVSRIEVHRWAPGAPAPVMQFAVALSNLSPQVRSTVLSSWAAP